MYNIIFSFTICVYFSDIDLSIKDNNVLVKVNGMDIPTNNLPYQHPTG